MRRLLLIASLVALLPTGAAKAAFAYPSCTMWGNLAFIDFNRPHEINLLEGYGNDSGGLSLWVNGAQYDESQADPRQWLDRAHAAAVEKFNTEKDGDYAVWKEMKPRITKDALCARLYHLCARVGGQGAMHQVCAPVWW